MWINTTITRIVDMIYYAFNSFLQLLGMYQKKGKICVCGIDNAGKTSIVNSILYNQLLPTIPTNRVVENKVEFNGVELTIYDTTTRLPLKHMGPFLEECNAILYVVDLSNKMRYQESRIELDMLLQCDKFLNTPIAICLHKSDLPMCPSPEEVLPYLNIHSINYLNRPIHVFLTSILKRESLAPVFTWLTDNIFV